MTHARQYEQPHPWPSQSKIPNASETEMRFTLGPTLYVGLVHRL